MIREVVAVACGTTLRQYRRFEKGKQKPGFDNLRNMTDFYGASVGWLMDRTERRKVWR